MIQSFQVTTIAGNGQEGFQDGNAKVASLHCPTGLCISKDGILYFADSKNHSIRMVYDDRVTTIAGKRRKGFQDGNARSAMFCYPAAICISQDDILYVNDRYNYRVRMINNDEVTTVAGSGQQGFKDGNALEAMFCHLGSVCISNDNKIYVTDSINCRIRMIYNNQVTTIAGNGQKGYQDGNVLETIFHDPLGICISTDGKLYVAEHRCHRIRMIYDGQVTTIAGSGKTGSKDGKALKATFSHPRGICISKDGRLYVSDSYNNRVRMIYNDKVTTISGKGKDGNGQEVVFDNPSEVCISKEGRLYVSEYTKHRIRMASRTSLRDSLFGFSLLLDMRDNILCDSQVSFNNITYHLHSTLVNARCAFLFDKSYYSLILQSNISNKSFESFLTFLYSNKLTKEHNEIWPANMTIKDIVELIFVFDVMMNCKWIIEELNRRLRKQLIEILNKNEQECVKELIVDAVPYVYSLQEIAKTKPSETITPDKISHTEYCYNILINELRQMQSIVAQHLTELHSKFTTIRDFVNVTQQLILEPSHIQSLDYRRSTIIVPKSELTELSNLAFEKTNIFKINTNDNDTETQLQSSISTQHLDKWTTPDFVIKLPNDDISYHVHKLILCGRWKYFCQMIESGLKEAIENEMTLTDDWNTARLQKWMKYIYLNEIEFDEFEDLEWPIESRKLYGIIVDQEMN